MKQTIEKLLGNQSLTQDESRDVMFKIMSGEYDDAQIAGFLIALRAKGERSAEIAGFAQAMRDKMTKIESVDDAIDMCGTGGDASGTFNISTAASFVVAGAGVPVAKHGNRAMTSNSGSADVLEALGVNIMLTPEQVDEVNGDLLDVEQSHGAILGQARPQTRCHRGAVVEDARGHGVSREGARGQS
mgnify:CR=1 FL=1